MRLPVIALLACAPLVAQPAFERVLFLGNSITLHGPKADIGWTGNWGMAATSKENDYVHLVTAALAKRAGREPQVLVRNIAEFERGPAGYDIDAKLKDAFEFRADLVVVAIGENVGHMDDAQVRQQFAAGVAKILERLKPARIVVRSSFFRNQGVQDGILRKASAEAGATFVDISALSKDESNYARSERQIEHKGVGAHPGDKGMRAIADAIVGALPASPKP